MNTPLRFVSGILGLWIAGRILLLAPGLTPPSADADPTVPAGAVRPDRPGGDDRIAGTAGPAVEPVRRNAGAVRLAGRVARPRRAEAVVPGHESASAALATPPSPVDARSASLVPDLSPTGLVAAAPPATLPATAPAGIAASRWSGNLYLYRRGDGDAALATGGQLGGSQAGGRIAYRLNAAGPTRMAAAARISSPLDDGRAAEAAVGLDWHPLPARPLRVSIERRIDVGGRGRNAWSAYAAGGFWRQLRPGLVVDGYGQAGVVGARRGDLFADGALRAGHRRELGRARSLTVGAGVWGAAQPAVARLDVGPRVALGLPVGGTAATLAAEWRVRVAGEARPRSGPALTLAADF
ncbi:hypothetical protein [Sphingomonas profundi]|uniref:hypothetical protein n=1 Tax=Alterirhizorhabdus profundi TaxID=2681549 RepID=UPI0012E7F31B|nr:hypothetical protein [Sphingomonas profundi]